MYGKLEFRKNQLALNSNTNLLISRHLALITHDATMSVNSFICMDKKSSKSYVNLVIFSLNFIRLLRVVITPSVTSLRGENDSKQSDEIQATKFCHLLVLQAARASRVNLQSPIIELETVYLMFTSLKTPNEQQKNFPWFQANDLTTTSEITK